MAFADRVLTLKLVTDVGDIAGGMKKTTGALGKVDDAAKKTEGRLGRIGGKIKGIGGAIGNWGKAFGGALIIEGIEGIAGALDDAWDGFRSGEKAAARLRGTFKNMGLAGGKATRALDRIAKSTKKLGVSDDEAVDAMGVLVKTTKGDLPEAFKRLEIAQDLVANGSAPNLASAIKIIDAAAKGSSKVVDKWGLDAKTASGRVDELGKSVKGAAKQKAAMDPLGVLFNAMAEDTEAIVGAFAAGDFSGIVEGFADLGNDIADALFGPAGSDDIRNSKTKGLVNQLGAWGSQLAGSISTAFDDIDWATTLTDTLNSALGAVTTAAENGTLGNLALLGGAIVAAIAIPMALAGWVATALSTAFGLPALIVQGAVKSALYILGLAIAGAIKLGMIASSAFSSAITAVAGNLTTGMAVGGVLRGALLAVGGSMAGAIVAGLVASLGAQWVLDRVSDILQGIANDMGLNNDLPLGPGDLPWLNRESGGPASGWTMVGEGGPELLRLPGGSHVFSNAQSAGMLGGAGTTINVTVNAGVGDPVAIGREVDRVLGAYRRAHGF